MARGADVREGRYPAAYGQGAQDGQEAEGSDGVDFRKREGTDSEGHLHVYAGRTAPDDHPRRELEGNLPGFEDRADPAGREQGTSCDLRGRKVRQLPVPAVYSGEVEGNSV